MSEQRVALYVYGKSEVTIAPGGAIDIYQMGDDYSTKLLTTIDAPTVLPLTPGVYGFAYRDKHGIEPSPEVTLVVDLQRKKPWPVPPPPPPPPYLARRDWNEHTVLFMSPLGFGDDGDGDASAPTP